MLLNGKHPFGVEVFSSLVMVWILGHNCCPAELLMERGTVSGGCSALLGVLLPRNQVCRNLLQGF